LARRAARRVRDIERAEILRSRLRDFIHRENERDVTSSDSDLDNDDPQSVVSNRDTSGENSDHGPNNIVDNVDIDIDNNNVGQDDSSDGDNALDGEDNAVENNVTGSDRESGESDDEVHQELTPEEKEVFVIESLREWALSPGVLSYNKLDQLSQKLPYIPYYVL